MPIVPILCGVLLIGGIVALVLSATTWRWYHITLGALIMLFSVVWFYLAARTLEMQTGWRNEIAKYQTSLAEEEKTHDKLVKGGPDATGKDQPSFAQLQVDLEKMLQGRGRRWEQVTRKATAPDTGKITAVVDKPDPSGIEKNMVLYVFDQADAGDGGQFLGEFEVTAVTGQEVQLAPVLKLRPSEIQRFAARHGEPLIFYEVMPTDSREIYAELLKEIQDKFQRDGKPAPDSAAIIKDLFPAAVPDDVKEEYAADGQPPAAGEPQTDRVWRRVKALKDFDVSLGSGATKQMQHVAADTELLLDPQSAQEQITAGNVAAVPENGAVYIRPLRDYVRLYRDLNLRIESLLRTIAEVDGENAAVLDAQQKVNKDIEYRTAEIAALQRDLVRFHAESDMMKKHVNALEQQVALVNDQANHAAEDNRQLETQLSNYQHQAAAAINRRIQAAMQANNKDLALPPAK
jgi:hypothetical protein